MQPNNKPRCNWVTQDQIYIDYHDYEWGQPIYEDSRLFEFLMLEGAQAGLNWLTILKKREEYRLAFDQFDAEKIACYSHDKINALLHNPGIVRNQLKIKSAVTNAQLFLKTQEQYGSFSNFIWQFVDGAPIQNHWPTQSDVPITTIQSDNMSRTLKSMGFKFVGSTICYAFMQAVGMVSDHTSNCFLAKSVR